MGFKRLERALTVGFRWYGRLVGRYPLPFFIGPIILTLFLTPGLFFMKADNDVILLFTPYNAPARYEKQVAKDFTDAQPLAPISALNGIRTTNQNNQNQNRSTIEDKKGQRFLLQRAKNKSRSNPWFFVRIFYLNESNIANIETFGYMGKLFNYLYHNFTCQVETYPNERGVKENLQLRYNPDFCNPQDPQGYDCPELQKQINFLQDILNRSTYEDETTGNAKIRLTYPVMYLWNRPVNWGEFLFGGQVNRSTGRLISASVAVLKLDFRFDSNEEQKHLARQCLKQMSDFILSLNRNPSQIAGLDEAVSRGLQFYPNDEWLINDEVTLVQTTTSPCIAVTAILVFLFTVISSYDARSPLIGALEAALGVLTIGLSLAASFALLFACGLPYNFVVTMTPLLTLCVGIDNDFLLISAWRRPYLERFTPKERLAHAFAEVGSSLTITSVNDILCFAVGCLSESPAISDFCLYTCISLAMRYLYQLTFFSGSLVYLGEKGPNFLDSIRRKFLNSSPIKRLFFDGNKISPWPPHNNRNGQDESPRSTSTALATSIVDPLDETHDDHAMHRFFRDRYSRFISRKWIRFLITFVFVGYLIFSLIFTCKLETNISVTKLFMDDSPLKKDYAINERYVLTSVIGQVIVLNPPDFRQKSNRDRFMQFVDSLEKMPKYAPQPVDTTSLWLRDYLEYTSYIGEPNKDFYDYLSMFLEQDEYSKYINDLRFNYSQNGGQQTIQVESFQFSTFYQNASTWDDSAKILLHWRRVCENYSDYEAIVHDYFFRNSYLDQRLTLSATTLQTMGIATFSIAFVTSLLMPDATSMFFICFSLFSVDLGVIAMLNLWGSDLDPMTMACLLMTIGFSVYYTARICYCYQKVDRYLSLESKLAHTLGQVGWPILQGGLGTLIGIIPLAFVKAYMVRTFFRTIVLVVFIGLLHGLLFMPVLMSLYDRYNRAIDTKSVACKRRKKMEENSGEKWEKRLIRIFV